MKEEPSYIRRLDTEIGPHHLNDPEGYQNLEKKMKFKYRKALGELLFCMVTCRLDISFSVIKLAKFANYPSEIHYQALKNIFRYLRATVNHGLTYWRPTEMLTHLLPLVEPPKIFHLQHEKMSLLMRILYGFVDADWAQDSATRKSITGIAMLLGGALIYYKTKFQPTIAHSTTEAEFVAACDAGKTALYLRSILDEIGLPQEHATVIYEDNTGALLMGNAQQPTRRTRHMDIKNFSLQDWIEEDLLTLHQIESTKNLSDAFTKQLGRSLFHKHFDTCMGKTHPIYYTGTYANKQSLVSTNQDP